MELIRTRGAYYLLAAIVVVTLVLLYAVSPYQADDFWYKMTSSGAASSWEAMADVWHESLRHWHFDTGRLANLVNAPFLTIVPKWLYALVSSVAVVAMVHYSRWLADSSARSLRSFLLLCVIVFFLPWSDYMFSVVFSLNYLWTSALVLFALWLIIKTDQGRKFDTTAWWASVALCFFAGWMHEGFSVPVLCGIVAYFAVMRRLPLNGSALLILAFACGSMLIAVSPGLWGRAGSSASGFGRHAFWEALLSASVFNCLYYIFLIVALIIWLRGVTRRRILRHKSYTARLVLLLVSTTVSTLIFFLFYGGSRMGWFGQLFSGIGILYCFRFYRINLLTLWRKIWAVVIIILVAVHFVAAVSWQLKLTAEFNDIRRLYAQSPDGVVYYNHSRPRIDATLLKPSFRQFNEHFPLQQFSYFYGPDKPDLKLLPTALRHVDRSKASLTLDPRIIIYHDCVLLTDTLAPDNLKIDVRLSSGQWFPTRTRTEKFIDNTGTPYTLVVPHISMFGDAVKIENARLPQ